jgi:hypothetical protein
MLLSQAVAEAASLSLHRLSAEQSVYGEVTVVVEEVYEEQYVGERKRSARVKLKRTDTKEWFIENISYEGG